MVEVIFKGKTIEDLAEHFAGIVCEQYLSHLNYWKATAMDDQYEREVWQKKIDTNVEIVHTAAYYKLLSIIREPKLYKTFYKKRYFKRPRVIEITKECGFYDDLLPDGSVAHSVPVNIHYNINVDNYIISKVYV